MSERYKAPVTAKPLGWGRPSYAPSIDQNGTAVGEGVPRLRRSAAWDVWGTDHVKDVRVLGCGVVVMGLAVHSWEVWQRHLDTLHDCAVMQPETLGGWGGEGSRGGAGTECLGVGEIRGRQSTQGF